MVVFENALVIKKTHLCQEKKTKRRDYQFQVRVLLENILVWLSQENYS